MVTSNIIGQISGASLCVHGRVLCSHVTSHENSCTQFFRIIGNVGRIIDDLSNVRNGLQIASLDGEANETTHRGNDASSG